MFYGNARNLKRRRTLGEGHLFAPSNFAARRHYHGMCRVKDVSST